MLRDLKRSSAVGAVNRRAESQSNRIANLLDAYDTPPDTLFEGTYSWSASALDKRACAEGLVQGDSHGSGNGGFGESLGKGLPAWFLGNKITLYIQISLSPM
jgi:hypothetical protein